MANTRHIPLLCIEFIDVNSYSTVCSIFWFTITTRVLIFSELIEHKKYEVYKIQKYLFMAFPISYRYIALKYGSNIIKLIKHLSRYGTSYQNFIPSYSISLRNASQRIMFFRVFIFMNFSR